MLYFYIFVFLKSTMQLFRFIFSKRFLKQLAFALVILLLVIFVTLQGLKFYTNHGQEINVPNLHKKSITEVETILTEANLRFEVLDSAEYNPKYPKFSVIEQNPVAGDKVKENRKIYLTINPSDYRKVSVPKIVQVTRRNATTMLKAVGLRIDKVTYVDNLGKNMVLRIKYKGAEIEPGHLLPKMSKIELVCGNGYIIADDENEDGEGENNDDQTMEEDGL